jgi:hypothetical protein
MTITVERPTTITEWAASYADVRPDPADYAFYLDELTGDVDWVMVARATDPDYVDPRVLRLLTRDERRAAARRMFRRGDSVTWIAKRLRRNHLDVRMMVCDDPDELAHLRELYARQIAAQKPKKRRPSATPDGQ